MQMVFHCGVHGTDLDRMVKTLAQNRDWLLKNGIEPLTPNRHRGIFEEALTALSGGEATPEMEEVMLDAILETDAPRRVICSSPGFLGLPYRAIAPGGLFVTAGPKMAAMANLFPSAEVEFFLALKNPATLVPYVLSRMENRTYDQVMGGVDPIGLRWGPCIQRILSSLQGRRIVIWCHEDTPMIWPEVVRRIATMPGDVPLKAGLQILGDLLHPEGIHMIRDEMAKQERLTVETRRAIFAAALAKYARTEMIDIPVDLPGWDQDLIDAITRNYDTDVAEIAAMPGVEFLVP